MTPVDLINFTSEERKKIKMIERRISRLDQRLADYDGSSLSWTYQERSALRWALAELIDCRS